MTDSYAKRQLRVLLHSLIASFGQALDNAARRGLLTPEEAQGVTEDCLKIIATKHP